MATEHPYRTLNRLGWQWHDTGALLWVTIDDRTFSVWVPLRNIQVEFSRELAAVGCPLPQGVGAPTTVGGFFSSLKRAVKSVSRRVRKAVPKSIRRAASRVRRKALRYARKAAKAAKRYGAKALKLATSREAQLALGALTLAVPVLAPATASIVAAQEALRHVDDGIKAANAIRRGMRMTPQLARQVRRGQAATRNLAIARQGAAAGDREAQQLFGAIKQLV